VIIPRHQPSPAALDLIKRFEGYQRRAVQTPDGRWTIGHGHTRTARAGAEVSQDDAEALLIFDLRQVAADIDALVFTPLTQNQFDALASFVFNIGAENFRHSAVLRRINAGELIQAAFALEAWRKADFDGERIVVDALVRRRAAEKALFLTPQDGWIAAPSALIEPKADHGLAIAAPDGPARALSPEAAEDDEPSPVQRAAANLALRLQALAPEAPPAPAAPEPVGEPAPFPESVAVEPEPEPPEPPQPPELAPPAPAQPAPSAELDAEALRRRLFGAPEPRPKVAPAAYAPLLALAAAGLVVFVAAVVWAFHAQPTGGTVAPLEIGVVVVGFVGILCVASAVYLLLEKFAAREP
jgi:lysozyme